MEANACGIPVITYNVPGCNVAVSPGLNGFLVDYNDTQAVVDILTVIEPAKYKESCVEYAKRHFDRQEKNQRLLHNIASL